MGPQHPMLHGLWSFAVQIDGEKIHGAEVKLGYIHKGFEKICETRTYDQSIPLMDRGICYASALTWGHLYTGTIERLYGIEDDVPDRAQWIRTLLSEAQRIASHGFWGAAFFADLGVWTGMMLGLREREFMVDLLEACSGQRLNYNYNRIGGVANDTPENFNEMVLEACDWMDDVAFSQWDRLFEKSDVFVLRTRDVGVMTKEYAMAHGVTGVNLRSTGVKHDLRKMDGYLKYPDIKFNIAVGSHGDVYDRYKIRLEEMKESVKIMRQCVDNLREAGDVMIPKAKMPRKPINKEAFFRIEDPRGESAMYVVDDTANRSKNPYRLKIKSPALVHMATFPDLVTGGKIADIVTVLGSIDLCTGETDR
jgi:NADH-quinone oxidoreductase subunit D